ncbi:hypothetical protein FCOIX_3698 [Fusarium coicis]|nr:hypothetical protein FCOIX_3698 [Fusarium coicis]
MARSVFWFSPRNRNLRKGYFYSRASVLSVQGSQPFDALVHRVMDMLSRETNSVDARTIVTGESSGIYRALVLVDKLEALRNDQLEEGNIIVLDSLAEDPLWLSIRVCIGDIPGIDALVEGILKDGESFVFVEKPGLPISVAEPQAP